MSGQAPAPPHVIVIAGPNGAGKTTSAASLLPSMAVEDFVNADAIARGLSAFRPEAAAMEAGRLMLERLRQLAARRATFAFETTLASRTFAPWIAGLRESGYAFDLFFLWLPTPEMALRRVARRVARGGHDVPAETVRRRYARGLSNFFKLYRPLTTRWAVYDNSSPGLQRRIARGQAMSGIVVERPDLWQKIEMEYGDVEQR